MRKELFDQLLESVRQMKAMEGRRWDPARLLRNDTEIAAYLNAALEEGDPAVVSAALGDIARAKGMSRVAKSAGLRRGTLDRALAPDGRLEFSTVLRVVRALGFRLGVTPARLPGARRGGNRDRVSRMKATKRARLEAAGWAVGSAAEFLGAAPDGLTSAFVARAGQARKVAKKTGMTRKDIARAVKKVRRAR
jgi:probable addiction module antidote protein